MLLKTGDIKISSLQLFLELGKQFDQEFKKLLQDQSQGKKHNPNHAHTQGKGQIEEHLLVDDHGIGAISKTVQVKIGGFLTNLMC